jgi:hypothetical protein
MTKQAEWRAKEIAGAPTSCRSILQRAYDGNSRAAGIKAFCLRCVGYLRAEVTNCTSWGCPLHPYRPYQAGQDVEEAEENGQIPVQDAPVEKV